MFKSLYTKQGILALTTGITIINKSWFKDWHQPIVEKVMNNPITKGGCKDFTQDGISDNETHTSTDTVMAGYDIFIQYHQVIREFSLKANL